MVPIGEVGGAIPEPTPPSPSQWWVSSRWLEDTDTFNEWMDEEDYELTAVVRREGVLPIWLCVEEGFTAVVWGMLVSGLTAVVRGGKKVVLQL